jgi:peptidoglycan-associated lipoprotein
MKMNQLISPLMIALVATLATAGCKKGNPKTTMIPGSRQTGPSDQTDINTKPFDPNAVDPNAKPFGTEVPHNPGPIALDQNWTLDQVTQDRAALAAYTVHFAFDSSAILSKEESKVIIVSESLKSDANAKLLIEGHCDERGTEEYNRALGERRALALRESLAKAGIDPNRIRTISYGEDKPADPGHDEAAWAKNRRGEFILCHPKGAL